MRKILTGLLIILTIVSQSRAENAYPLRKGEPAPVDGILLTPEEANRVRVRDIELDYKKKENELLIEVNKKVKEQVNIMEQRVDFYQDKNIDLANRVETLSSDNFWQNTIWFIVGVGATIGVGYAASRTWR